MTQLIVGKGRVITCTNFLYFLIDNDSARIQHGSNPEHSIVINFKKDSRSVVEWHREIIERYGSGDCEPSIGHSLFMLDVE